MRCLLHSRFQSTLPARGATRAGNSWACAADFNPRSPHGERRAKLRRNLTRAWISIHAPRTGSDMYSISKFRYNVRISIHAPRTGSDSDAIFIIGIFYISIHAPRTGSDPPKAQSIPSRRHFNPRSPHGERPPPRLRKEFHDISIHAPRTGSDDYLDGRTEREGISIHAPRTGSDSQERTL